MFKYIYYILIIPLSFFYKIIFRNVISKIDYSKKSIEISKKIIKKKNLKSKFAVCNMKKLPFRKNYFNCIVDVFSSTNLNSNEGDYFLKEVSRTLKKGG